MFATFTDTRQNTPAACVLIGSAPRVFFEQSTLVTVNSNLPSRAGWFSPTACAESPPPEADGESVELSPPPDVAMAMITTRATMASKIHLPLPFFFGAGAC